MRLVVTEVTEMHIGWFCVACWRPHTGRMVRPLPDETNWSAILIEKHNIAPGMTFRAKAAGEANGRYPHRTEDHPIDSTSIEVVDPEPFAWLDENAPSTYPTLAAAFDGHLQTTGEWDGALKGAYVPDGIQTRSLAGLRIDVRQISFFENNFQGQKSLRARLNDGKAVYNLPVSSREQKEAYRAGGLSAVEALLPQVGPLHVRVGLARPFDDQPNRCTIMLNGINR